MHFKRFILMLSVFNLWAMIQAQARDNDRLLDTVNLITLYVCKCAKHSY